MRNAVNDRLAEINFMMFFFPSGQFPAACALLITLPRRNRHRRGNEFWTSLAVTACVFVIIIIIVTDHVLRYNIDARTKCLLQSKLRTIVINRVRSRAKQGTRSTRILYIYSARII